MESRDLLFLLRKLKVAVAALCLTGWASAATPFLRGDANADGSVDLSDPITVLLFFGAGQAAAPPLDALDANDDGDIDVTDAIHLLQFLFTQGASPAQPYPGRGLDPTPTDPFTEGDPQSTYPDLRVRDLYLDPGNTLIATVENIGQETVPALRAVLRVFVDGEPSYEHRFGELGIGGPWTIDTDLRLSGSLRRVAAIVDPDNAIVESNEFQNSRHYTVNPAPRVGPDLVVTDLVQHPEGVRVAIRNAGSAPSRPDLTVSCLFTGGASSPVERQLVLPGISAGETVVVPPESPWSPTAGMRVRAHLVVPLTDDDLDNTDNLYEEVYPDGPSLDPYVALLDSARIGGNIVWQGSDGVRAYPEWTSEEQASLFAEIAALERLSPLDRPLPPPLEDPNAGYISTEAAWQVFLRHVAHCLWVEVHRKVPWRLEDFPDNQLAHLLDARTLVEYRALQDQYRFASAVLGYITAWNPRICHQFLRNLGAVRATQLETIYALTDWMRGYLIHKSGSDDLEELYGYPGWPPVDRILYSLRTPHKSPGCSGLTGIYGAVLRSVNIPVVRGTTRFYYRECTHPGVGHSRPEFPSVGLSMPHGDDVYNSVTRPVGAVVPSSELFFTLEDMQQLFLTPDLECSSEGWCNSVGAQASKNSARAHLSLAHDYDSHYLLYTYAQYGPAYLDDSLRGQRIGGEVVECAQPIFLPEERSGIVQDVEARLREIGDGDLEAGKAVVLQQSFAWGIMIWP